jgi:protein-S-isoprenylcysteine O-methyltransferase Ste14
MTERTFAGKERPRNIGAPTPSRARHHWSDWVGFTVYSCAVLWGASKGSGVNVYGLPILLLQFLYAAGYLLRGSARQTLPGVVPRLVAYATAYIMPAFLLAAGRWAPQLTQPVANPVLRTGGWILGSAALLFAIRPLWYLRKSFSIEPVARELVTTGPYAFARHPIYTTYLFAYLGLWISTPRPAVTVVLLLWFGLLLRRIQLEEAVLESVYPEYAAYRQRVGMFWPRLTGGRSTPR